MTSAIRNSVTSVLVAAAAFSGSFAADRPLRLEPGVENLLVCARVSGNLESFDKGIRGAADHMIYDQQRAEFAKPSQYNEYGVGFGQDLGVVPEAQPAWWIAEWEEPVQANLIQLSGVYPNQPQPNTAWKIEIRRDGEWKTHDSGVGGSSNAITHEFNGNNDPWSMYVVASSGVETWIVPAPVGARVAIDKRTEGHLYAEHPLGQYLKQVVPAKHKALYDAATLSSIISRRLDLGWIKEVERVDVAGPDQDYAWTRSEDPNAVRVIREIDQQAMQRDLFDTMKGKPTRLIDVMDR